MREEFSKRGAKDEFVYSEIIAQNLLENSWWTFETFGWITNSGSVDIEEDESGFMNLTMDSSISSQVKQQVVLNPEHYYFVMFDVKVTRYNKGLFGLHVNGKIQSGMSSFGIRRLSMNQDYETIMGIFKTEGNRTKKHSIFVGSISAADGAGKIRKLSLYDLTELYGEGNEPTVQEFYSAIPSNQNEEGIRTTLSQMYASLDTKINHIKKDRLGASDKEAHAVFIEEMNKKARLLGMNQTQFKNVQGFKMDGHTSTSRDFLKLGFHAMGHNELLKVWGTKRYDITFRGQNARVETILTTVKNSFFEEKYDILGGKTGTIGKDILNVIALTKKKNGELHLSVVMGASGETGETDRFEAIHQLITLSNEKSGVTSENDKLKLFKAISGSSLRVPSENPLYFTNCMPLSTFSINEKKRIAPASLTKLMTALVVIENIKDLNELVTVTASDISGGSGPLMYSGDQLSIKDILYLLMMPSSNTAAKCISRIMGHKIIQARGFIE